jgi:hypothetical protein
MMMATARMVEVDLNETGGSRSPRKKGRAPAVLVGSPTGDDDGKVGMAHGSCTMATAVGSSMWLQQRGNSFGSMWFAMYHCGVWLFQL